MDLTRFHRTMAAEWAFALRYRSERARRRALPVVVADLQPPPAALGDRCAALFSRLTNVSGQYNQSEEFRRDAVELYRSRPHATVVGIVADLGIVHSTLSGWLRHAGVAIHPRPGRVSPPTPAPAEAPSEVLARLRARVADLEAEQRKLGAERDILRAAAKYFAGGTRW